MTLRLKTSKADQLQIEVETARFRRGIYIWPNWEIVGIVPQDKVSSLLDFLSDGVMGEWDLSFENGETVAEKLRLVKVVPYERRLFKLVLRRETDSLFNFIEEPRGRVISGRNYWDFLTGIGARIHPGIRLDGALQGLELLSEDEGQWLGQAQNSKVPYLQRGESDLVAILEILRQLRRTALKTEGSVRDLKDTCIVIEPDGSGVFVSSFSLGFLGKGSGFNLEKAGEAGDWQLAPRLLTSDDLDFAKVTDSLQCTEASVKWVASGDSFSLWRQWLDERIPTVVQSRMSGREIFSVHLCEDEIKRTHSNRDFLRTSRLCCIHKPSFTGDLSAGLPWTGLGSCRENRQIESSGPWTDVSIMGFETDASSVVARRVTPSVGKNGAEGMDLPPSENNLLALSWSGQIGRPVLVFGAVRIVEPSSTPSLFVDDDSSDFRIGAAGGLALESGSFMDLSSEKEFSVSAPEGGVTLQGNGASLKVADGRIDCSQ